MNSSDLKALVVGETSNGHPAIRTRKGRIWAFKLPRHPWRVYTNRGQAKDADAVTMTVIIEVYDREGKVMP